MIFSKDGKFVFEPGDILKIQETGSIFRACMVEPAVPEDCRSSCHCYCGFGRHMDIPARGYCPFFGRCAGVQLAAYEPEDPF